MKQNKTVWMVGFLCAVGACAKTLPGAEAPQTSPRPRPGWATNLAVQVDAMTACLETRETPRYVAFVDALPSGLTGVSTVDAYGSVEHCAYQDGKILRRERANLSAVDISQAGGALLSLGHVQPTVPLGVVLEEVVEAGHVIGWLYWPAANSDARDPEVQL